MPLFMIAMAAVDNVALSASTNFVYRWSKIKPRLGSLPCMQALGCGGFLPGPAAYMYVRIGLVQPTVGLVLSVM
jgi:hypothetical protein